jgi:hypothetical protein
MYTEWATVMFLWLLKTLDECILQAVCLLVYQLFYLLVWMGRKPGRFRKPPEDVNSPLSHLPLEIVRDSVLPFLSNKDLVRLESLITDTAVIAVLHDCVRSGELRLTRGDVDRGASWLYFRSLSPRKLILIDNYVFDGELMRLLPVVHSTESFVLKSAGLFSNDVVKILFWRLGKRLRELDVRQLEVRDDMLCELHCLSQLRVLHVGLSLVGILECLAVTLDALPLLEELGVHNCMRMFTVQHATMLAAHCTKLTSLTLTAYCRNQVNNMTLSWQDGTEGIPARVNFALSAMAPYLNKLRNLSLSVDLSPVDMDALATHYGHLQQLTFFHAIEVPGYAARPRYTSEHLNHMNWKCHSFSTPMAYKAALFAIADRHCRQLRRLRWDYLEKTRQSPPVDRDPGPTIQLELRMRCRWLDAPTWQALRHENPGVEICPDV